MTGRAHVGCSGWSYASWRGRAYPAEAPPRTWFGHYAERFDFVELNTTFYRLPAASTVAHWHDQAPPGFCYAVKLGRFGTHRKKLLDSEGWLARHLERVEALGQHLGPNLVQLPPRWRPDPGRLDAFLAVAPASLRWAVELRDPRWLRDDVFEVLERHGAALCVHDLLAEHPWERTAAWAYVRFHGPDALRQPYHGRYGAAGLRCPAAKLRRWLEEGADVYAAFNNDVDAAAVDDAAWLRDHLAPRRG